MGRSITSRRGPLPAPAVFADDATQTQFSGIVPLNRYLVEKLDIVGSLARVVGQDGVKRFYGRHLVLFSFLVGSLALIVPKHIEPSRAVFGSLTSGVSSGCSCPSIRAPPFPHREVKARQERCRAQPVPMSCVA